MLALLWASVLTGTEPINQFQIKNATRTVTFTYGTYQIEELILTVQDIDEVRHKTFCHGIHLNHYEKVGFYSIIDDATGKSVKAFLTDFNDNYGCLNIDVSSVDRTGDKKDRFTLYIYLEIIESGNYISRFTNAISVDKGMTYNEIQKDRAYQFNVLAQILSPYYISTQITYVQTKVNMFQAYSTELKDVRLQNASRKINLSKYQLLTPRNNVNKVDQIVIGPLEYNLSVEPIDFKVAVITSDPTFKLNVYRRVWTPGMFVSFSSKMQNNQMANLHAIDNITIENTDQPFAYTKESRAAQIAASNSPIHFMTDQVEILLPLADHVRVYDRTGKITSLVTKSNATHTKLIFKPRHAIFGGQSSDFTLEYDLIGAAKGDRNNYGALITAAPKFQNLIHYFEHINVCQYAPSTVSEQVKYYYSYQPEKTYPQSEIRSLDFNGRQGQCAKYNHVSQEIGQSNVGIKYTINVSFVKQRFVLPGIGAGVLICATWFLRMIS